MTDASGRIGGVTLRQAALIAGLAYLLSPVTTAEYQIYPKLVVPGHIDQTVHNIGAHPALFAAMILCYLVTFLEDIVLAWALYILLAPVNRALSLLAAWFRLIYAAVALVAVMNLATAYRVVTTPDFLAAFGSMQLLAQVKLLLSSFRYEWSLSLVIFAIHLLLIGVLIFRSGYIPKFIGALLAIDGVGWLVDSLQPYLYPNAHLDWIFITFFGELIFMLWLLIWGWRLKEPAAAN